MKRFSLASLGLAAAQAASTRNFVEGVGENGTSGQFVRVATGTSLNVVGDSIQGATPDTDDDITW